MGECSWILNWIAYYLKRNIPRRDTFTGNVLIFIILLRAWELVRMCTHTHTHTHTRERARVCSLNGGFLPDAIVENEITMYIQ